MTRNDIPNLLTYLRLALALATFAGLLGANFGYDRLGPDGAAALIFASLAAFVIGSLTDFFDGWLARRWNAGSAWGAMLDPIADKIAVCAAVISLVLVQHTPTIAIAGGIILFREMFVSGLREAGAARGLSFPVTRLAKWKTTLQLVALSLEMAASGWLFHAVGHAQRSGATAEWAHFRTLVPKLFLIPDLVLWVAALVTVWTGVEYALAARAGLRANGVQPARTKAS